MAPEQVRGQGADHRSDIFAFGAIVYEMLSGQRAFRGDTAADTMSAILAKDPPDLPVADRHIPPALARIVDRCVEKSASARFQSTRDLAFALEALTSHSDSVAAVSSVPVRTSRQRLAWMLVPGILLLVGAVGGFVLAQFSRPAADERVFRLQIDPPEGGRFVFGTNVGGIALSPDGRTAAYIAAVGGTTGLWVRSLDNTTPRVVPGTVGAAYPFWSPDGTSIAFLAGGKLQRADLSGGTPRVVADLAAFRGGAWTNDGRIILGSLVGGLFQVPASGGKASPLTTLDSSSGDIRHAWPQVLPSGRVLYWAQTERLETTGVYAASLTRPAERVRLLPSEANAIYAPGDHERGHLLWLQGGTLMAQPFDPASLRLSGEPHPIADPAARAGIVGQMHASASMNGVLLYSASTTLGQFAWFDRSGKPLGVASEPGEYTGAFRLSPDGYRAVATRDKPGGSDLWLLELERGIANRFTSTATSNVFPVWSPDGRTIVGSNLVSLFRKSAGGAGTAERVIQAQIPQYPTDWSQDGRLVLYYDIAPGTQRDLWALPVTSEGKTAGQGKPYLRTPFSESWGRFFPEPTPRWVAYQSDVSGRYEVYIDAFPEPRSTTRISTGGGQYPQWGPQVGSDGRELFYLTADFKLMVVTLKVGKDSVEPTTPRELFALPSVDIGFNPYDTTPSGQRFLVRATPEREASQPLTVIVNWPALLKK
jgi:Tol biopolymer transport system component